jgi:hypothetical protein
VQAAVEAQGLWLVEGRGGDVTIGYLDTLHTLHKKGCNLHVDMSVTITVTVVGGAVYVVLYSTVQYMHHSAVTVQLVGYQLY